MRKTQFANGEHYHIYNRGVDKRAIFLDRYDLERFFQSMQEFNNEETIGSIYENLFRKAGIKKPLVKFLVYCLNPNHYHFVVEQIADKGIEKFMHRVGLGYAKYFNNKYKRTGSLFQGRFQAKHIDSNTYLLHLSAYVNGNNQLGNPVSKLSKSSFDEYFGEARPFCDKSLILGQFSEMSSYKDFFESSLENIKKRKQEEREGYLETGFPSESFNS